MPRTGTPTSNTPGSIPGAPSSFTDAGPPESTRPTGRLARISCGVASKGTISEYTWHSRTRRAMSCAYCAPKSRTRTGRATSAKLGHPHALGPLVGLALGLDGRRDHELRLLELPDVRVAGRCHGHPEAPEQVQRAVVLVGRADQDLLERPGLLRRDARAPGQRR